VARSRKITSAIGDRQIFPVQTKMIRKGVDSSGLSAAKFITPLWGMPPSSTRPISPGNAPSGADRSPRPVI
jgi:hypothetical protein